MLTDLLGGQVQVAFDNLPASIEHIKAGRLRALAVSTAKRSEALPEIPTLGEFLPGYETSSWLALGRPDRHAGRHHRDGSTRRSTPRSPIPASRRSSSGWARPCSAAPPRRLRR